jgi:hypothetical protein
VLDAAHRTALRAVAQGTVDAEHATAVRNLAVAGLVAPQEGVWAVTQAGHAVLEVEGAGGGAGGDGRVASGGTDLMAKVRDWFMT